MLKILYKTVDTLSEWLTIITTVAMCLIIFLQVVFRYCFSNALPWPEEAGRFLFLWVTYLGISIGMKRRGHLSVSLFVLYLPPTLKKYVSVLGAVITAAFFLFITCVGVDMTMKMERIGQLAISMPLPVWTVWMGIPLSAFFTFLQCCRNIAHIVKYGPDSEAECVEVLS